MIYLILALFAFGILNIIHHITVIEQLKQLKHITCDVLDELKDLTMEDKLIQTDLDIMKQKLDDIQWIYRRSFNQ